MPKVDEAAILKQAEKSSQQSSGGGGCTGRVGGIARRVSFFGLDRLDADDRDESALKGCMNATARF